MLDADDRELLTAWGAGESEALAVLIARHHGAVQAACRRQAPPGEVEDCVQAVFLVLSRRRTAAARAPVLLAWLLRTARLVCRQAQRARRRRERAERQAPRPAPPGTPPEALDHLDACLDRLPQNQRAALSLHFLAGQPPEAVAAALGTTRDQVYVLVHRGLARMRDLLAQRGIALGGSAVASLLASEASAAGPPPVALITALTTGTPTPTAATLATGAITAMFAQAAALAASIVLVLGTGLAAAVLAAGEAPPQPMPTPEPVAKPAVAAAAEPPPAQPPEVAERLARIQPALLDATQTTAFTVDGVATTPVDGLLELPVGRTVRMTWTNPQGKAYDLPVVVIDGASGAKAPAWALDQPTRQADGSVVAVGRAFSRILAIATSKALLQARSAGATSLAGVTDTTVRKEGGMTERVSRTSTHGTFRSTVVEQLVEICADPATAPPPPTRPDARMGERWSNEPVRCWVRLALTMETTEPENPPAQDPSEKR